MCAGVRPEGAPCRGHRPWEGVSNSALFIKMSKSLWQVFLLLSSSAVNPVPGHPLSFLLQTHPHAGSWATLLSIPGEKWEGRDCSIYSSGFLNSSPEGNGDDTGPRGTTEKWAEDRRGLRRSSSAPRLHPALQERFLGQGSNWVASLGTEKMPEDVTRSRTSALGAGKGRQASCGRQALASDAGPRQEGPG